MTSAPRAAKSIASFVPNRPSPITAKRFTLSSPVF
jgi:hypothetical protein